MYQQGNSVLHRTDAVSKFVWLFAVAIAAIVMTDFPLIASLFVLVLLTGLVLGRVSPLTLLRRGIPFLLIGAWLTLLFSIANVRHGVTVISIGQLATSTESVLYGGAIALRVMCLGVASVIFVVTTEPRRMVSDLIHFGHLPYRLCFAIYAALRFLPQVQSEARTIRHAHAVRAVEGSRGPIGAIKDIQTLTVPLLSGVLRRVQVTAVAMDSRGFGAYRQRTPLDLYRPHPGGIALAFFQVLLAVAAVVLLATGQIHGVQTPVGG